ncbi:MAG: hypothetical protein ACXAC7_23215 [Candidatus Hodarchaeales archaeon]|jgi:hypothetical protein
MAYTRTYSDKDKNHPIIKKLLNLGWTSFEIAYASRSLSDCGWTIINTSIDDKHIFGTWLGFTIKDALRDLNNQFFVKTEKA